MHTLLTKLGDHEQGDEGEMLVRDEAAGCSVKVQDCIVVAREDRLEEAWGDG